jgi:hypothetical protein
MSTQYVAVRKAFTTKDTKHTKEGKAEGEPNTFVSLFFVFFASFAVQSFESPTVTD